MTLTERATPDKVDLLLQKNLYAAAISLAYSDPQSYRPHDVVDLYRRHAEHLYRRGDYAGSMDRYVLTIGSLEPSHVVFRFLDAPRVRLAARYLTALRDAGLAAPVHDELLRTILLRIGDGEAAAGIAQAAPPRSDGRVQAAAGGEGSAAALAGLAALADDPPGMLRCGLSFFLIFARTLEECLTLPAFSKQSYLPLLQLLPTN